MPGTCVILGVFFVLRDTPDEFITTFYKSKIFRGSRIFILRVKFYIVIKCTR